MIVRVQFVEREKYQSIYPWCLFSVENNGTKIGELFEKIYEGTISCGRVLPLQKFDKENVQASVYSGIRRIRLFLT